MILPREIRPLLEQLEPVVERWPVEVVFDRVMHWLLQFEPKDYEIGARIVRHINVLGSEEIRSGLGIAYTRLQRKATDRDAKITSGNTIFAAIGDVGKSGGMIAYEFRITNELPEANFAEAERANYFKEGLVQNVVLIDDVLGTGGTALEEVKQIVEETTTLGVKNFFVLSICGFTEAVEKVREETGADTFSAYTYGVIDTVASLDADFYSGLDHELRTDYLDRLKYYNRRCTRSDLGYGTVGALLAFRHNTPNVSIPVLWGTGNGWKPLFPRVGHIPGIERYYAQIQAAHQTREQKPQPSTITRTEIEITLLVEGKFDEEVFDIVIEHCNLEKRLGVQKITTVSVGFVAHSLRLLELIKQGGGYFIMVLDGDQHTVRRYKRFEDSSSVPVIFLKPNPIGLLNITRLTAEFHLSPTPSAHNEDESISDELLYKEYEIFLKNRWRGESSTIFKSIIQDFVDEERLGAFVTELDYAIERLRQRVEESSII